MLIAMAISIAGATSAKPQAKDRPWRFEAATYFGALIAGKEVARGVNATGGEQLIAKLNHGGALGVRAGLHSDLLGLEANFLIPNNAVAVKNEFGVSFPNHGKKPLISSADVLLYPFRRAIGTGKIRPYLTGGVGGVLMSADLDNINDQETHGRLMWNSGGGVEIFVDETSRFYFDLRFTNHRLARSSETHATDLRSITVGVGYRF
jgi:opacity protein-like surface antigen